MAANTNGLDSGELIVKQSTSYNMEVKIPTVSFMFYGRYIFFLPTWVKIIPEHWIISTIKN